MHGVTKGSKVSVRVCKGYRVSRGDKVVQKYVGLLRSTEYLRVIKGY